MRKLLLELSRGPARVAERDEHVLRPFAAADRLEDVLRRREAEVIADRERRLPVAERPMEHEPSIDLHGTAEMHRRLAQRPIAERDVDLLEQRGERHIDRLVDHNAERAFGIVLADVSQRIREMRIRHRRHRDQEVVGQIDRNTHGTQL